MSYSRLSTRTRRRIACTTSLKTSSSMSSDLWRTSCSGLIASRCGDLGEGEELGSNLLRFSAVAGGTYSQPKGTLIASPSHGRVLRSELERTSGHICGLLVRNGSRELLHGCDLLSIVARLGSEREH